MKRVEDLGRRNDENYGIDRVEPKFVRRETRGIRIVPVVDICMTLACIGLHSEHPLEFRLQAFEEKTRCSLYETGF